MGERFDVAIIGSGPAGISAAINCKIRNKSIVIFGQKNLSSKLVKAPKINNYLGFYDITGEELKNTFKAHMNSMNIEINEKRITNVYAMGDYFALVSGEEMFEARAVILCTGIEFTKPLPGELEFLGRGMGYCATCDAPLYKGKVMTVIGYTNEAEEEANYISELASKVYYIPMYRGEPKLNSSIQIEQSKPVEIKGSTHVDSLKLEDKDISTDVVFVLKDSMPPAQLVPGLVIEEGHIAVNRKMETNLPGLYAAGDCTGKPYQYMKAAGEGQSAALNVVSYLEK